MSDPCDYHGPMLRKIQFAIASFLAAADVRSRHWCMIRGLRQNPTTARIEEAILYRHRLRQLLNEFLEGDDPRLWDLAIGTLLPMLEALNEAIPEAEQRAEG